MLTLFQDALNGASSSSAVDFNTQVRDLNATECLSKMFKQMEKEANMVYEECVNVSVPFSNHALAD